VAAGLICEACTVARNLAEDFLTVKTQGPSAGYERSRSRSDLASLRSPAASELA
jgi:hypothetical protein